MTIGISSEPYCNECGCVLAKCHECTDQECVCGGGDDDCTGCEIDNMEAAAFMAYLAR